MGGVIDGAANHSFRYLGLVHAGKGAVMGMGAIGLKAG
jgi:hypothetical protein